MRTSTMRKVLFLVFVLLLAGMPFATFAQDMTPMVSVQDQVSLDGTVTIDAVYSAAPGFVVIHIDNGGSPGPVAGVAAVATGLTTNLRIPIDTSLATPMMFAMLHEDTGAAGVYEFGTVDGADLPVSVDGNVVTPAFNAQIVRAHDQFVSEMGSVTIASVVTDAAGWLVIHADNMGTPGPVLGQTLVNAGSNTDVVVELAAEGRTDILYPMLHVDTGAAGVYEFGTVTGADGPVVVNGVVATFPISTVPAVRASSQLVITGDMGRMIVIESVLSEGPGWLVIHSDNAGSPGPVLAAAAVENGTTTDLMVHFEDSVELTPVVWPMLHVDTGVVGEYEFGTVEGADAPVSVGGSVVTFPISIAPSITVSDGAVTDGVLVIDEVVSEVPGWLVIHSGDSGSPGPVLGQTQVNAGVTYNVRVAVDAAAAGALVFPMLHVDTGTAGVYEFGTVEGADAPVSVGGNVVVVPMALTQ